VVVENVSGAAGVVGVTRAERSEPDGYTIQWACGHQHGNGAIYSLDFDMLNDSSRLSWSPRSRSFSTRGNPAGEQFKGTDRLAEDQRRQDHGRQFRRRLAEPHRRHLVAANAGLKWQMVPYRSAGLSMQDLAPHRRHRARCAGGGAAAVAGGNIKTYAVAAKKRVAILPDIPTTDEAGLPGFYFSFWHAIWAPKGTPKAIVAKLNAARSQL